MPTLQELITQALRAKNVGAVKADPGQKAADEYTYATEPFDVMKRTRDYGPLNPVIDFFTPSRADIFSAGMTKAAVLGGKALAGTKAALPVAKAAVLGPFVRTSKNVPYNVGLVTRPRSPQDWADYYNVGLDRLKEALGSVVAPTPTKVEYPGGTDIILPPKEIPVEDIAKTLGNTVVMQTQGDATRLGTLRQLSPRPGEVQRITPGIGLEAGSDYQRRRIIANANPEDINRIRAWAADQTALKNAVREAADVADKMDAPLIIAPSGMGYGGAGAMPTFLGSVQRAIMGHSDPGRRQQFIADVVNDPAVRAAWNRKANWTKAPRGVPRVADPNAVLDQMAEGDVPLFFQWLQMPGTFGMKLRGAVGHRASLVSKNKNWTDVAGDLVGQQTAILDPRMMAFPQSAIGSSFALVDPKQPFTRLSGHGTYQEGVRGLDYLGGLPPGINLSSYGFPRMREHTAQFPQLEHPFRREISPSPQHHRRGETTNEHMYISKRMAEMLQNSVQEAQQRGRYEDYQKIMDQWRQIFESPGAK